MKLQVWLSNITLVPRVLAAQITLDLMLTGAAMAQQAGHWPSDPAERQALEQALSARTDAELAGAVPVLAQMAREGYGVAQSAYGALLYTGRGVPADPAGGKAWLEAASAQGIADASYRLGQIARNEARPAEAAEHFRTAMQQGHPDARQALIDLMGSTPPAGPEPSAGELPEQSADGAQAQGGAAVGATVVEPGSPEAKVNEAIALLDVTGHARDPETAAQLLQESADAGVVQAQLMLARLYLLGDGVPQDCVRARNLLRDARARGSETADRLLLALPC
ncbi:MAG: tetratricopeptide repeat protein [Geminicoccaceae bacterium]